ncbi:MAG: tetratricopeptide repeat protein [Erythrobacter sp.]
MIFTTSLLAYSLAPTLAFSLQVGPNPTSISQSDGHTELRDRQPRESGIDAFSDPSSEWLAQCLARLSDDASRAHTMAQIRRNATSGSERVLANHCLGLAATELGLWEDAIVAFGAARDESPTDELRVRARFGTMAGNGAMAAGDAARALPILQQAKSDAQGSASAPLQAIAASDLARALVSLGMHDQALNELDDATRLMPDASEGWLLKATLLRRLDRLDEAQTTIELAGALAPQDGQIGLEAGVIAILSGREDAARQSWQSVIDTQPDSLAAQTAREYLAQIGPPQDQEPAPLSNTEGVE